MSLDERRTVGHLYFFETESKSVVILFAASRDEVYGAFRNRKVAVFDGNGIVFGLFAADIVDNFHSVGVDSVFRRSRVRLRVYVFDRKVLPADRRTVYERVRLSRKRRSVVYLFRRGSQHLYRTGRDFKRSESRNRVVVFRDFHSPVIYL